VFALNEAANISVRRVPMAEVVNVVIQESAGLTFTWRHGIAGSTKDRFAREVEKSVGHLAIGAEPFVPA
jgi:hypothetical protein